MTPDQGPFDRYYFSATSALNLRPHEQVVVIILKFAVAFHWSTVIARFVFVFNNLDTDQKEFQLGWDALNRFCSFFHINQKMAMELRQYVAVAPPRTSISTHLPPPPHLTHTPPSLFASSTHRYYLERNQEMKARSRRKVLSKFSPYLAEEVVWELDKKWLVRVPCFSLVAERLTGEELRFFVKVALAMDVSVFVPKDRPPPRRLYLITQGVALYKGKQLGIGASWGAEDVLLVDRKNSARLRAFAMTYLHVQWLDAKVLDSLKAEFPRAHLLCRFWTMMHAVGEFLLDNLRRTRTNPIMLPVKDLSERLNREERTLTLVKTGDVNKEGRETYKLTSSYVTQGSYEIVRDEPKGAYHVIDRLHKGPSQPICSVPAMAPPLPPPPGAHIAQWASGRGAAASPTTMQIRSLGGCSVVVDVPTSSSVPTAPASAPSGSLFKWRGGGGQAGAPSGRSKEVDGLVGQQLSSLAA